MHPSTAQHSRDDKSSPAHSTQVLENEGSQSITPGRKIRAEPCSPHSPQGRCRGTVWAPGRSCSILCSCMQNSLPQESPQKGTPICKQEDHCAHQKMDYLCRCCCFLEQLLLEGEAQSTSAKAHSTLIIARSLMYNQS